MSFKLQRKTNLKNGTQEFSEQNFTEEKIIFGRGANCHVILIGQGISLQHLQISKESSQFIVEDLNSLSGVTVNGLFVKRAVLKTGDKLGVGSQHFTVTIQDSDSLTLSYEIDEQVATKPEEQLKIKAEQFSTAGGMPPMRKLSWIAISAITLIALIYPSVTQDLRLWSSGEMTSHHKVSEADCASCHSADFSSVSDKACLQCHALAPHAPAFSHMNGATLKEDSCVSCHQEHNGEVALTSGESKLCTQCHADIRSLVPESKLSPVTSWDNHPAFHYRSASALSTFVKLNHQVHLKPNIRGANGAVTLTCKDCHALTNNRKDISTISMTTHCSTCHSMEFDERLAGKQVPHGSPDAVYQFLIAEYAKLMLEKQSKTDENSELQNVKARKPGPEEPTTPEQRNFIRAEIEKLARSAEKELFTKTGCRLCHDISSVEQSAQTKLEDQKSLYAINHPNQFTFTNLNNNTKFNHGSHDNLNCESCHRDVTTSTESKDLLMPILADCKACHSSHTGIGKLESDCIMCHSYHEALPLEEERKQEMKKIVFDLRGNR